MNLFTMIVCRYIHNENVDIYVGFRFWVRFKRMYLRHFDDFSAAEAEFLVVVQHSVHTLDPQGVNRPVKHEPLLVGSVVCHTLSDETGYYTVSPREKEEG